MLNRKIYPYKKAVLRDRKGDIKKRWHIKFSVFDVSKNRMVDKYDYEINKFEDVATRRRFARKFIAEIDEMLEEGYVIGGSEDKAEYIVPSLEDAFNNILQIKKSEYSQATYNAYSSKVNLFLQWIRDKYRHAILLTELDKNLITDFLDSRAIAGQSPTTINNFREALSGIFNDIIEREECINDNPFKGIKKRKEILSHKNLAYRPEEKKKLLNLIKSIEPDLYSFVQFMYYTFMRPNEIRQLQVNNILIEDNRIFIEAFKSKNKKDAFVTIPPAFKPTLQKLIDGKTSSEYLYPGTKVAYISKNLMSDKHRRVLERFEFKLNHTLYSWKHTGVVDAYRAGIDIKSLQLQLRHHSLEETDTYLKSLGMYTNKAILTKMPSIMEHI